MSLKEFFNKTSLGRLKKGVVYKNIKVLLEATCRVIICKDQKEEF